jgi:hypothetical protein
VSRAAVAAGVRCRQQAPSLGHASRDETHYWSWGSAQRRQGRRAEAQPRQERASRCWIGLPAVDGPPGGGWASRQWIGLPAMDGPPGGGLASRRLVASARPPAVRAVRVAGCETLCGSPPLPTPARGCSRPLRPPYQGRPYLSQWGVGLPVPPQRSMHEAVEPCLQGAKRLPSQAAALGASPRALGAGR